MTLEKITSANEWADYWYYEIGVNVIPATNKHADPEYEKRPFWTDNNKQNWIHWKESGYQENSITEEQYKAWKKANAFKDGMAIICGMVYRGEHKGKWLNGIDCDNKLGIDEMCPSGLERIAGGTVVEQHSNKEKCHIYFYTDAPIQNKGSLEGKDIPGIEIKSMGKNLMYCAGGTHKDGSPIQIIGTDKIKTMSKSDLEQVIDEIFKKYNLSYLEPKTNGFSKPLHEVSQKLYEGQNRGGHILSYLDSKKIKNPELNEDDLFSLARSYENKNCVGKYDDDKIKGLVKQAMGYGEKKLEEDEADPTQTEILYDFAKDNVIKLAIADYDTNQVYVKIQNQNHIETINLDSSASYMWLMHCHRDRTGYFCKAENYKNALKHLKADAYYDGTAKEKIYTRIAQKVNEIYYDLCSSNWDIIKITQNGFTVIPYTESTPFFDRHRGMTQQRGPKNYTGDPLDELCNLMRIEQKTLFKVHLIHFFLQEQETPIMVITGEHGSVKTTQTQSIKKIVDPSSMNIGSFSSDRKEIQSEVSSKYLTAYDNVSGFRHEVSDLLCRAITGDEIAKRALYTDNDLFVKSYHKRKIVLNGISPNIEFPDFNDRSIYYDTAPIMENEKIAKSEYWLKFDRLLPSVMGQIFTVLSKMLATHDRIGELIKPETRMADFEKYGETISQSLGLEAGVFLKEYREKREIIDLKDYDSYPILRAIDAYVVDKNNVEMLTSDFYKELTNFAITNKIDTYSKESQWPKKANLFSSQVNQLKKQLRISGLDVKVSPYTKRDKSQWHARSVITISRRVINTGKQPQPPQPPQPDKEQEQKIQERNKSGKDGKGGKGQLVNLKCSLCPSFRTSRYPNAVKDAEIAHQENMKDPNHILEVIE